MTETSTRRQSLARMGGIVATFAASSTRANPQPGTGVRIQDAGTLSDLVRQLGAAPRRRQFKTVPFMLTDPDDWDDHAARLLLEYRSPAKQVWENTDMAAAWPVLMREAMSGEVFAHRHPDFLQVAAMHGSAHLALFNDGAWARYRLAQLAGPAFPNNTLIREKPGAALSDDPQDVDGFYGPNNNNIVSLQRRGAVFVACHDSIHTIARRLHLAADATSRAAQAAVGEIAADLTNNLIPDCVLVPSVVAFLVELQVAGFTYCKGS